MQKETVEILKNFSSINQGIVIRKGNKLKTMSVHKNVFASSVVPDNFEREIAVYDLNELLSTLSLFTAPEISYKEDHILIKSGKSRVRYKYSSPSVIVSPPVDKNISIQPQLTFKLQAVVLEQIMKASSVMKLKELEISESGLRAFNKSQVGNKYVVEVEGVEGTCSPKVLSIANLKLLPRDYTVEVDNRAVRFTSVDGSLEYIVAVEIE